MKIVDGKEYMIQVKKLILEYTNQLNRDLSFQKIEEELNDPSKKYTAPQGEILVAIEGDAVLRMVAYHLYRKYGFDECAPYYNNPMDDVIYMIKRL